MQVTCPNGGARYAVDPAVVGPAGRTVQCVRCSHRWFLKGEATPAAAAGLTSRQQTVPDFVIRPQIQGAGLPALTQPRPKIHWGRWLAAVGGVLVVLGAAAFAGRDQIRDQLPPEWRPILSRDMLRSLFAPPSPAARHAPADQAQLEIDLDASKVELVDGRYVVLGEVVNTGRAPGSTTRLKLIFRKDNDVLGERVYPLVEGPIGPGARLSFRQALDDPPSGTTEIVPAVE
ncbi:MAG: zinc-ribbon domain-containing protein [Rhodospirillales bacterium]|nr:zinc-ribbon domain-containing protein [Rhodospirillales bacterium]